MHEILKGFAWRVSVDYLMLDLTRRLTELVRSPGHSGINVGAAAEKIVSFVRANDGQGVREIAAGTALPLPVAKKAAAQLLASGQLKKSGQKRGTIYHVGSGKPSRAARVKRAKRGKRRGRKTRAA